MAIDDRKEAPDGTPLPPGVWGRYDGGGRIVAFKIRWRETLPNGSGQNRSKTFDVVGGRWKETLRLAVGYLGGAREIAGGGQTVARPSTSQQTTLDELFGEWIDRYGLERLTKKYLRESARDWDRYVSQAQVGVDGGRTFGELTLRELIEQPEWLVSFQEALDAAAPGKATRRKVLFLIRGVLRRGQRWHPDVLVRNPAVEMFEMPSAKRRRLVRAPSLVSVHRIREAILNRPARDPLNPIVEAAFVSVMAEAPAVRPSEILNSARWHDLHQRTLWIQRPEIDEDDDPETGLKTGARAALILPTARQELLDLRSQLERRFGPVPDHALIFQRRDRAGLSWTREGDPVAWSLDDYKRFTARVFRPARTIAASAPDVPGWVARMRLYDLRHGAVSLALHGGVPQHQLCKHAGHSEKTLDEIYGHIIKEYEDLPPIDMAAEAECARAQVAARPHRPSRAVGPQREQQRRRRAARRGR